MRRRDDPEVRSWLSKAAEDLEVVRILRKHGPALEPAICFHCQQAAEKAVKALFVFLDRDPPRIHDLGVLASGIRDVFPQVDAIREELSFLTGFAVIPRYPAPEDPGAPLGSRGAEAARKARRVSREVRSLIRSGRPA